MYDSFLWNLKLYTTIQQKKWPNAKDILHL